jgi:hypothetical protein
MKNKGKNEKIKKGRRNHERKKERKKERKEINKIKERKRK